MTLPNALPKLLIDYGAENLRSAMIRHWANTNQIGIDKFKLGATSLKFLDSGSQKDIEDITYRLKKTFPQPSLKDVEKSFELSIHPTQKKSFGAVYTPNYIIDYLTRFSLQNALKIKKNALRICDPSCGSGGFLIRVAELLDADYGISADKAFSEIIVGLDIDRVALEQAKCLIELYLASKGKTLPNKTAQLFELDTLTTEQDAILSATNSSNGFDVIVTNPPYVKFQNLEPGYRQALINKYDGLANGNFSLSVLFLVKGYELLSQNGCLGIITQNNLFTSLTGRNIREYLQKQQCLRRIVDFGHHQVFDNASAYTCLIFLSKEQSPDFEYSSISDNAKLSYGTLDRTTFSKNDINQLKPAKWRLGKDYHLENIKKIENIGRPLKAIADIRVGFATLKDSVFFAKMRDQDCVATTKDGVEYSIEAELTRPAVKVPELRNNSDFLQNKRRIIFPYQKQNGRYVLIPEQELIDKFPNAYKYLCDSREILEARDKGKKSYGNWYAWARTQGMEALGPKLLTKTFSKYPSFLLDNSDQLFCNGYSVSPKQATLFEPAFDVQTLQLILNSKVMYYYSKLTSFQIEGDYQCYQKNFIEKFGIPQLTSEECQNIKQMEQSQVINYLASLYNIDINQLLEI